MTVADFDMRLRIHRAALLLVETDLPVERIAASVGYSSRSHFSRRFASVMGADPTRFRRNHDGGAINALRGFFEGIFGG